MVDQKTVLLDLPKSAWEEKVILKIGCLDGTPLSECPRPKETEGRFCILSITHKMYHREMREIITVAVDIHTKEYGSAGSTQFIFVSGIGIFSGELPGNIQLNHLDKEALQRIDKEAHYITAAYRKTQQQ
ncbi:MAG: hypothetical protein OCC46_13955 [Pseudodesulfovibrio sp.]